MSKLYLSLLVGAISLAAQDVSIRTIAGSDWIGDGEPARTALLLQAEGIAAAPDGTVYVSDAQTHRVRRIGLDGVIQTIADGTQLAAPYGLALDGRGNLFVADLGNRRVRRIAVDGSITTVEITAPLLAPRNVAVDAAGVLYVSDFDRGVVLRVGVNGATAVVATLQHPAGLAVDRAGVVYVGDTATHTVRRIEGASTRVVATVTSPTGLAFDAQGTLHVADGNGGGVFRFPLTGALAPLLVEARDVAVGGATVYTTDGTLLRRFTATTMSVIAGHGERWHGDGGPATEARLWDPRGLALDAAGNLYIADSGNHRVRRVDARGVISTFATSKSPRALGFDAVGDLLVDGQRVTPLARIVAAGDVLQRADGSRYVADLETDRVYLRTPVAAVKQLPALAPGMLLEVDTAQEVSFNGLAARVAAVGFVVVPESLMPGPVDVLLGSVKVAAVVVAAAPRLFAAVGEADVIERGALMTLYGTGQGVEPLPVRVRVGVYDAEVLYSGPVAGYPGLWQVNARVPAGFLAPGLLPVTVTVGEAVSAALLVDVR